MMRRSNTSLPGTSLPTSSSTSVGKRALMVAACSAIVAGFGASNAEAGIFEDYQPTRHDRFVGGGVASSGNETSQSYLLRDFDVTAIGVGTNGGVLISDRHVLAANHFRGGSYSFVGNDGVRRDFAVDRFDTTVTPGAPSASDVVIATLSTPVDLAGFGINPLPIARSPLARLNNREIFVYDQDHRVGTNRIDGGRFGGSQLVPGVFDIADANGNQRTFVTAYDFDGSANNGTNGTGQDEAGVIAGDSGHPTLVVTPVGELAVLGTHFAVDRDNPTPADNHVSLSSIASVYFDQIESIVQSGGGGVLDSSIISGPGDANADGSVNLEDFLILRENFGQVGGFAQGNFNDDDVVNLQDFLILRENFGNVDVLGGGLSAPRPQVVPEPAAAALLLAPALLLRRRRSA